MTEAPGLLLDDRGARHLKRGRRMPDMALRCPDGAAPRACGSCRMIGCQIGAI
jgi:hypothetical protein